MFRRDYDDRYDSRYDSDSYDSKPVKRIAYAHDPAHKFFFNIFSMLWAVTGFLLTVFPEFIWHFFWDSPPLFRFEDKASMQTWGAGMFVMSALTFAMNHMGKRQLSLLAIGFAIAAVIVSYIFIVHSHIVAWKAFLFPIVFVGQAIQLLAAATDMAPVHQAVSGSRLVMRQVQHKRPLMERLHLDRMGDRLRHRGDFQRPTMQSSYVERDRSILDKNGLGNKDKYRNDVDLTSRDYVDRSTAGIDSDRYGYDKNSRPIIQSTATGVSEFGTDRPIGVGDSLRTNRELYTNKVYDDRTDTAAYPTDYMYSDRIRYPRTYSRRDDYDNDDDNSYSRKRPGFFGRLFGRSKDTDYDHDYAHDYDVDHDQYSRDYNDDDYNRVYRNRSEGDYYDQDYSHKKRGWFGSRRDDDYDRDYDTSHKKSWFGKNKDKDVDRDIDTSSDMKVKDKEISTSTKGEKPYSLTEEKTLKTPSKTKHSKLEKSVDTSGNERVVSSTD